MYRPAHVARLALALVGAVVLTACGSTVAQRDRIYVATESGGIAQQTTGDVAPATGRLTSPGASSAGDVSQAGAIVRTPTANGQAPHALGPSRTQSAGSNGSQVRKAFKVGVIVVENTNSYGSALGVNTLNTGDFKGAARAVFAYVNSHGGVSGHPVVADYFSGDPSKDANTQFEAACSQFTEDNHDQFVIAVDQAVTASFITCLAHHKTPFLGNLQGFADQAFMNKNNDYLFSASAPNLSRIAELEGSAYPALSLVHSNDRVGLIRAETPEAKSASEQVLKPALARAGITVASEFDSSGDQDMSQAVVRFSLAHVDHVLFLGATSQAFLFAVAAQSQNYTPVLLLTSADDPEFISENVPARQLHGAVALGWAPTFDVLAAQDPPFSPARRLCRQMQRAAGVATPSRLSELIQDSFCDALLLAKAGIEAGGGSPGGLRAGIESLGSSWQGAISFTTAFGAHRHDAPEAFRLVRFGDSCACFAYEGQLKPFT